MVFQDPFGSLNPTRTIEHHLTRPLKIHKQVANKQALAERLEELLTLVEYPLKHWLSTLTSSVGAKDKRLT